MTKKKAYELKNLESGVEFSEQYNNAKTVHKDNDSIIKEIEKTPEMIERGTWGKGLEFLLSCISMSVGLGNVWRFPYVAYMNGGGAFLLPYLLLLFIVGRPLYYMEMVLGQFSGRGPIKVWKCVPALKGIGFAQIITNCFLIIFYNYLMALTLFYLFASFQDPLPWSVCDVSWAGTCNLNETKDILISNVSQPILASKSLTDLYFHNHVLHLSDGLNHISYMNWRLVGCLVLSWTLVYLCIVKGVQSLGKVVYFTAIFPYVVLFALLVAAMMNDGAIEGIKYFFEPKWEKLLDPIVWFNAVQQSFFSLGVCFGSLLMYSSYNNFRNNVYKDAIIISIADTLTSMIAGCVIFAVLGSMALKQGVPIDKVINQDGVGLAFIAYPEALANLRFLPQLWSFLFFVMLFTLGIGSSVGQVETILTTIKDEFTGLMRYKSSLAAIFCAFFCLCGIPLTTDAGLYMMKLLEDYGVGMTAFLYGIVQTIGIVWIYGLNRFCSDVEFMLNRPVGFFWKFTWAFATPLTLIIIFVYGFSKMIISGRPTDSLSLGIPDWGFGIGWAFAALAIFQIPFWLAYMVMRNPGSWKQKIKMAFQPSSDWGPTDPVHYQAWMKANLNRTVDISSKYQINPAFIPDYQPTTVVPNAKKCSNCNGQLQS